ncbi:MAG: radical SAM protein [Deltaproteobacteria bacterium]|nr:radical SAM protein [Deltaproteobacteria bacterium]
MTHVFGPVPSRRLGLSLGVDLIPAKTCSFDCLYCQVGKTTKRTVDPKPFVPVREVVEEVRKKLLKCVPDAITLAGSGEPTLHSEIDLVITSIKKITGTRVVVLTNGSLFWKEDVRNRVLEADVIMPTLTSAYDHTFRMIHRPHPELDLNTIVDGLTKLRQDYKGQMFLELVFLAGINDTEKEIQGLKVLIDRISPEKIQLNTVVRPPADSRALSLDIKKLEEIMVYLGKNTEIVAEPRMTGRIIEKSSLISGFLEMVKRRPLKPDDIADSLNLSIEEVGDLVKGLLIKGYIRKQEHSGEIYYLSNESVGQ